MLRHWNLMLRRERESWRGPRDQSNRRARADDDGKSQHRKARTKDALGDWIGSMRVTTPKEHSLGNDQPSGNLGTT
ncbi:unnamed protein product [Brassica napus]|uniref:(rape) hypothetical protein n=1 Tax=Brassica napus TaxID=3708 RepID=A0A816Y1Y2_BRANA|nr:unnamed protein product [Brassica napus]